MMPHIFTARTSFLPPEQQQSAAAMALSSLGSLATLAGAGGGVRTPADMYVALMASTRMSDSIIDKHELMQVYEARLRVEAREELRSNVRISVGKKDGLITVEVDDRDPLRAAAIANDYVKELRALTSSLAITEAQQRRRFFEALLSQTSQRLLQSQKALMASGFQPGNLRAEPRAAIESYARIQAEVMASEVRLRTLRNAMTGTAAEVQRAEATLAALRTQLSRAERADEVTAGPGYLDRFREFKYAEALFELYARQLEIARVDESREGGLIQVIDAAAAPERRSSPRRALTAVMTTVVVFALLLIYLAGRASLAPAPRRAVS
jgi:capsule polysaccharide export protein KpsE/RkpR